MPKLTRELIAVMTAEEIESELSAALNDMTQIRAQLDSAKALARQNGNYADANWFARATTALHIRGREHQMLQLEFAKKRKAANRAQGVQFERQFMYAAKRILPDEMYQAIIRAAHAEVSP